MSWPPCSIRRVERAWPRSVFRDQPAVTARRRTAGPAAALGLLVALALAGCRSGTTSQAEASGRAEPHGWIVLAVGVDNVERLNRDLLEDVNHESNDLARAFRGLHPRVGIEIQPFESNVLPQELARRTRDGLAPDLLLVSAGDAHNLAARGLIRPLRLPPDRIDHLDPMALARVRLADGRLLGLPVMLQPQLACFDRRRVARSPASWDALLQRSQEGLRVGLPMQAMSLAWTLRPLGAGSSVKAIASSGRLNAADQRQLQSWLERLRDAQHHHGIQFLANQDALMRGLIAGELDWVSCRSDQIASLRKRGLGSRLGVALLPSGPGGPASPLNRLRVLVFGTNSTEPQRQAAEALGRFSLNPPVQRRILLEHLGLPVTTDPLTVAQRSPLTASLITAAAQGASSETDGLALRLNHADNANRCRHLLMEFLYGERDSRSASLRLMELLAGEASR